VKFLFSFNAIIIFQLHHYKSERLGFVK